MFFAFIHVSQHSHFRETVRFIIRCHFFFRCSSLSFTIAETNAELNCILKLCYYNYTFVSNYWIYCCLYYILSVNKRFQYYKWLIEWENVHFHKFNEHTKSSSKSRISRKHMKLLSLIIHFRIFIGDVQSIQNRFLLVFYPKT